MKKLVYILIFLCSFANGFSQGDTSQVKTVVEVMPEYPGGMSELMKYLQENISYPSPSKIRNQQGKVFTKFVVRENGTVSNVEILKSSGYELIDIEAKRVVECMPKWEAGTQDGKPVPVYFNLPINFKLSNQPVVKGEITNKEYSDFYYDLGVKYSAAKKYESAIENYTKSLKYSPEDIDALYNRGVTYLNIKTSEKACDDWKKIKELGKTDADELLKKYCSN